MLLSNARAALLVALLTLSLTPTANAITLGQVDDFQDMTLQNWNSGNPLPDGNPNPPLVAPICGPSGNCGPNIDYYARITASGISPQPMPGGAGRAIVLGNGAQWAGDYLAEGVNSISLSVNNLGTTDIHLRLSIFSAATDAGTFSLTNSILVEPHGTGAAGWTTVSFDLDPANWTSVVGPMGMFVGNDINLALASVTALRIVSSAAADFRGDSMVGLLGVDNITAVPEPGTFALLAGGLAFMGWRRSRA